jgi:anti-sigma factor RsiW
MIHKKSCEQWSEAIIDRLADELSEAEAIRLEQHLSDCPSCAAREGEYRRVVAAMAGGGLSSIDPGSEDRLLRELRALSSETRRRDRSGAGGLRQRVHFLLRPIPVYAALALVLGACLSGAWLGRETGPGSIRGESRRAISTLTVPEDSSASAAERRTWVSGFVGTPSDAVSVLGTLGHDTL